MLREMSEKFIRDNATKAMDQKAFQKKYDSYVEKYEKESARLEELKAKKVEKDRKANQISAFMFEIHEQDEMIHDFDEKLWITTIEKVVVGEDCSMTFQFKNDMEVTK